MKKTVVLCITIGLLFMSFSSCGSNETLKTHANDSISQSTEENTQETAKISGHFTKEEIDNLQCESISYSHRTMYGKINTYLGQTTINDHDQIYIQSSEFINLQELRENWIRGDNFYVDLIALNVQPNEEHMSWYENDPCTEAWSYRNPRTRIGSICFNENHVFIGTTDGPEWYAGDDYFIICLDKKTGKEVWKRQVNAPIDEKCMMLIDGTLYCVLSKLEQGKWENTLYAVNPSNGKTKWDAAVNFSSLLYDNGIFYNPSGTEQYSFSISNREETFLLDWVGSSVSENCHLQGFTETIQVGTLLCKAIHLIEDNVHHKLIVKTYDISTNEPAWSCSIENDGLSTHSHLTTDGQLIYFSSWGNALCVAIDPETQDEKWRIEIEDYWLDQVYPAFNKVYLVLSQYTMFGKHQLPHSQIVLGVNPKTGEIIKRSPIVTYSGIALIEGTYKNNLITQGQNGAFLEFYSISDQ